MLRRKRDVRAEMEARLQAEMAAMAVAQLAELRRQYENRIADLKDAHELRHAESMRVIKALAEDVEYLRAQHFGPRAAVSGASVKAMPDAETMFAPSESPLYMSEEEEDAHALHDAGILDDLAFREVMRQLGRDTGLPLSVEPQ